MILYIYFRIIKNVYFVFIFLKNDNAIKKMLHAFFTSTAAIRLNLETSQIKVDDYNDLINVDDETKTK